MTSVVMMMMISTVTKNRISVLVLECPNRSRVMVLVFINWILYKNNLCGFCLSKSERFWQWLIDYMLCLFSTFVMHWLLFYEEEHNLKKLKMHVTNEE